MRNENSYQASLVKRIKKRWPHCIVTKGNSHQIQGIPDLRIDLPTNGVPFYAVLECKRSANEPRQPNQSYYIDTYRAWGAYSAIIYPENEKEVLDGLAQAYEAARAARGSQS